MTSRTERLVRALQAADLAVEVVPMFSASGEGVVVVTRCPDGDPCDPGYRVTIDCRVRKGLLVTVIGVPATPAQVTAANASERYALRWHTAPDGTAFGAVVLPLPLLTRHPRQTLTDLADEVALLLDDSRV